MNNNFRNYVWDMALEKIVDKKFNYDEFILPWMRYAWELIMDHSHEENLYDRELTREDILGDKLLWIMAFYDIYFDYLSLIGLESGDYNQKEERFWDWQPLLVPFLKEYIGSLLLGQITDENYDFVENISSTEGNCNFFDEYSESQVVESVNNNLCKHITKRRNTIIKIIKNYYKNNSTKILWFLSGYEHRDEWTDYPFELRELEKEKENNLFEFYKQKNRSHYNDEDEIINEYMDKISLLRSKYPVSIENLEDILTSEFNYGRILKTMPVYEWIENGMYLLE